MLGEPKDEWISLRVNEPTKRKLEKRAQNAGRTVAGHVRWLIDNDLRKDEV
jgi:predicted DNA-binding protein